MPVLPVVYLIGFGVPALGISGLPSDPVVLGGIALTLCCTAHVAEVYRAGLDSIHPGQRSAAVALGLTERRVAQITAASQFNYTPLLAAALLYLAVTVPLARIVDRQQARAPRRQGQVVAP